MPSLFSPHHGRLKIPANHEYAEIDPRDDERLQTFFVETFDESHLRYSTREWRLSRESVDARQFNDGQWNPR